MGENGAIAPDITNPRASLRDKFPLNGINSSDGFRKREKSYSSDKVQVINQNTK